MAGGWRWWPVLVAGVAVGGWTGDGDNGRIHWPHLAGGTMMVKVGM